MPINGIGNASTTALTETERARRSKSNKDTAKLDKACAEFEALLVQKLFQTMRASIPKSGLIDGGSAEEIYTAMLDQQVAQDMALQGGLGLSARMKAQIIRYMDNPVSTRKG